jgi:hypothetical protein
MSTPTRVQWERQPRDPDPETDLGYEALPLQVFRADTGGVRRLLFLPADPSFLEREAFIITDAGSVRPLDTCL